jgi:tellurite resistance protein
MSTAEGPTAPSALAWIAHVPLPLFAVVMGLGGLGLAWRKAHEVLGVSGLPGEAVLALAAATFAAVAVLYLAKAVRHREAVIGDFTHIVRINFFPAVSISLLILAVAALPYHTALAEGLWVAGAALHLTLSLVIVNRWITRNVEIQHSNPSWFIPVVGNILVPIAGVPLGHGEVSWFFFAIGLVFWLILFTVMLYRIIFHDPMPAKILPTLFILLAPPAIGFVAYARFMGPELDALGRVLFFTALFLALVLVTLAPRFLSIPFFVSWWAYTFPSAALAIAALLYHQHVPGPASGALAVGLLAAATLLIVTVWLRTLRALLAGHLFVPEG